MSRIYAQGGSPSRKSGNVGLAFFMANVRHMVRMGLLYFLSTEV